MPNPNRWFQGVVRAVCAAVLLACGGSDTTAPTVPPVLTAQSATAQTGTVGAPAPASPTVVVRDSHGAVRAGITVTFTPDSNAGTVATPTAVTNASGVASSGTWTLGTRAQEQRLTASATVDGVALQTTFSASAVADRPSVARVVSGGGQDGPFGATLITPVRVLVTDRYGNPTPGVTVHFGVDTGGVTLASAVTGSDGSASTRVRLPRTTGPVALVATPDSVSAVTTTLTSRGIRFAKFSMDANVTCGLSTEGYPYCWGDNAVGQLAAFGVPAGQNAVTPQPMSGDYAFSTISVANVGACGLRLDGTAVCWGSNVYGANGNGGVSLQLELPAPVTGGIVFTELRRGEAATCGATSSGQAYCWGGSGLGQVGAASVYQSSSVRPVLVDGSLSLHGFASDIWHTCALDPAGAAYCWGSNRDGQLGISAASKPCTWSVITSDSTVVHQTTCAPTPVAVGTSVRFAALEAASGATCGLTSGGQTYCWGNNEFAQLGTGGVNPDTVPTQVAGVPPLKELHGHDRGFCGLTSAGDIYCWGYVTGALGVSSQNCPTYSDCTPTPSKVQVGRQFQHIDFTTGQLCGVSDGVAYCWGGNYRGALGIGAGDNLPVTTPTAVAAQLP